MRWAEAGGYMLCGLLALVIVCAILDVAHLNLRVPIGYADAGDLMPIMNMAQRMHSWTWMLKDPNLGAPFGANWGDYSFTDILHWFILYPLAWLTSAGAAINLYYIAGFPLIALTALFVLRHFGVAWPPAVTAALLYAFLPYHFFRRTFHLALGEYWVVPLAVMVVLWIAQNKELLTLSRRGRWKFGIRLHKPYGVAALIICIFAGAQGVYYAFFAGFLLGVAALIAFSNQRSSRAVAAACAMAAVIVATLWMCTLPTRIHTLRNGPNPEAIQRDRLGPEVYALRITQLLLPMSGHRIPLLASGKAAYNRVMGVPWINENDGTSLGAAGAAGFLFLLGALLWRAKGLLGHLSLLNISAVLLATASGLGPFAALIVGGWIRSYNRIVVYIAFFSLCAAALAATAVYRRFRAHAWATPALTMLSSLVLLIGIFDQTCPAFTPNHERDRWAYSDDEQYVRQLEASVPRGAMIFQLPYMSFPEAGLMNEMMDYDPMRPRLHSTHLRWSYGEMRGRSADLWYRKTAAETPAAMVDHLALANFAGIWVDRFAYKDRGFEIEQQLARLTGVAPTVRADNRISFFALAAVRSRLGAERSPAEFAKLQERALEVFEVLSAGDCYGEEQSPNESWRWCGSHGGLRITNEGKRTRRVAMSMKLDLGNTSVSEMDISAPGFHRVIRAAGIAPFDTTLDVPPGGLTMQFSSSARRVIAPADARVLVFRIVDLKYQTLD